MSGGGYFQPLDPEELGRMVDRQQMHAEERSRAWHRLITEELTLDQLELLGSTLAGLSASYDPARTMALCNYLEGQVAAVINVRRGEAGADEAPWHAFEESDDQDDPYCRRCGLPPANECHHGSGS